MDTDVSLANIINEHIVAPIKAKFDCLLKSNAEQDAIIASLKQLCEQNQNQIDELRKALMQANENILRQSEEINRHLDLIQKQTKELSFANNMIECAQKRQAELEDAISNIAWEE